MARSGVYHEAAAESQSMKDARPDRGSHPPGTFYYYNNWDRGHRYILNLRDNEVYTRYYRRDLSLRRSP